MSIVARTERKNQAGTREATERLSELKADEQRRAEAESRLTEEEVDAQVAEIEADNKQQEAQDQYRSDLPEVAELVILGSLSLDAKTAAKWLASFEPDFFADDAHRQLCRTLKELAADGTHPATEMLRATLDHHYRKERQSAERLKDEALRTARLNENLRQRAKVEQTITYYGWCADSREQVWAWIRKFLENRMAFRMIVEQKEAFDRKNAFDMAKMRRRLDEIDWATQGRSALPEIEDACDFCRRDLPLPPELVEGLLHQGSKMSLGGASKAYKSWSLLDLALSVGYGMIWLGCGTVQSRVLVINLEIQEAFCRKRLATLAEARGVRQEPARVDVWNLRGYATSHKEIFPKIVRRVGHGDYGLIVLDPIYKLYGDADENSARDVAALLNSVEAIAEQTGAAVAFGAHFSKGNQSGKNAIDRVSGSGVFARDPDAILTLTAHEEPDCFTLDATLRNLPPVESFVVRWKYPLFLRDGSLDPARLKPVGRPSAYTADELLKALGESAMGAMDWLRAAGCSKETYYRLRPVLEKEGKIRQDNQKRWSKA